ncbi:MAG: hypothetical protein PVJ57_09520 [Phycisphaerae bacterium]
MAHRAACGRFYLCLSTLAGALLAIGLPGCSPPPPSQDALFYYLSVTRYGGSVRRAWPAGQAYLDGVMTQYRALEKAMRPLDDQLVVESLWPAEDPRWTNAEALAEHIKELDELLKEDGERAKSQTKAVEELTKAFDNLPKDLPFNSNQARAEFVGRLWTALVGSRQRFDQYLEGAPMLVAERRALYATAQAALTAATQPASQPTTTQPDFAAQHAALLDILKSYRASRVDYAKHRLPMLARFLRDINKREERQEYELLSAERDSLRKGLESIPKSLRDRAEALAKEVRKLEDSVGEPGADAAYVQRRIDFGRKYAETLRTQATDWTARVTQIVSKAAESAGPAVRSPED